MQEHVRTPTGIIKFITSMQFHSGGELMALFSKGVIIVSSHLNTGE